MPKEKPIEVITPPNALKAKIGGPLKGVDKTAVEAAERGLAALSPKFEIWLDEEVNKLEQSWENAKANMQDRDTVLRHVYAQAHDLKGLAATYEYPLVTRFAASLCSLIGDDGDREMAPESLIEAHVTTCRAAVRDKIRTENDPVGLALANELETQVKKVIQ